MTFLLPRLPGPACDVIVRRFLEHGPSAWAGFRPDDLPDQVRFAATGGAPVPAASLATVRQDLVAIARKHGFEQQDARQSHAGFDAETAAWLAQSDLFTTGEALRDDVWAFVASVIAPDITHWRFGRSTERYAGGVRNTFQRLWMRGRAIDRGAGHPERWGLLDALTEDALVQITERPSIGAITFLRLRSPRLGSALRAIMARLPWKTSCVARSSASGSGTRSGPLRTCRRAISPVSSTGFSACPISPPPLEAERRGPGQPRHRT